VVAEIGPDGFCLIQDLVQIWSRFGPDLVQIEVHPGPDQKIWTACPDMLSRFWTKSRPVQTAFSHNPCFFAEAAPLVILSQPPPPSRIMPQGWARGVMNYKNEILINIVSNMLPNSEYAWQAVATAYQAESSEKDLCDTADLKKHWHKVLCNCGNKPMGKPGAINDHTFCCIVIK
jgi:hypothetical protein